MNLEKDLSNDSKMKEQNNNYNNNIVPKQESKNQRQIAYKILLSTIIDNEYVIEKEQEPNYLKVSPDIKIYRANVIAVVVGKEKIGMITNLLLDDSSGKITARIFEESKSIKNVEVGDCIQLIGKIRVYNEEKYVSPEIIKKIDLLWLRVRSIELKKHNEKNSKVDENSDNKKVSEINNKKSDEKGEINSTEKKKQKEKKDEDRNVKIKRQKTGENDHNNNNNNNNDNLIEDLSLPSEKIIKLIKEIDKGNGVFIEELIEKSPLDNTEKIIQKMLENGDIFQNLPGKVKVL